MRSDQNMNLFLGDNGVWMWTIREKISKEMEGFRPEKLERWSYYLIKQELHHEMVV